MIEILAETLEVARPDRCTVAVAVQDNRSVVAFSDAHGLTGGQYLTTRKTNERDFSTLVPAAIADRLHACNSIAVLASAPILGSARLLSTDLAWSYTLKGGAPAVSTMNHRLVIANPDVPAELNLSPLGLYIQNSNDLDTVLLSGGSATPSRVLQAMRNASVIEFHTHGFIANDVSEASYLVLSPEPDRTYAITARDVAQVKLQAAPLIILGACHAAMSSLSLEGGMGLAEAFLRSGARAVIASPEPVQDLGAVAFFSAVRERVMHGVDPAVAVRDERQRRLATSRDDTWVSGVVVFE